MHKIRLITVGKLKEMGWAEAQAEFIRRLSPFTKIEVVEVAPDAASATVSAAQSMRLEAERLLGRVKDDEFVIALDRVGKDCDSITFSKILREEGDAGRTITFVIGGSEGLDAAVLTRANRKISLSKMTFTHEMARVFLLEQIYRAMTIISGKTYHR